MRSARRVFTGFGLVCSASLLSLQVARAEDAAAPAPPDLPPVTVTIGEPDAPEPIPAAEPTLPPPDLPAVVVSVPPAEAAQAARPPEDLLPPALPDAPVTITAADRLRSALAVKAAEIDRIAGQLPRREREALAAHYARGAPLWVSGEAFAPAAKAVMHRLKAAAEDGLDPTDYRVPDVAARAPTPEDWAETEIRLSAAAIRYARDARGARIEPPRISRLVTPTLALPGAEEVLATLGAAADADAALASYNPPHPGYRALKARLAQLRGGRPSVPMVQVPQGRALRVGMRDPRVPLIRARFGLGAPDDRDNAYDERVASAVADFQREKGLPANGVLTPQTVAALSGFSSARLEGDLVANMELWRWLPADLGARHIAVNVPEYRLRLVAGGTVVHQTRVIVGKAESPTPVFSDEMETVIVNPSWTVPPSILRKEFLPALANDPYYAERRGFRVFRRGNTISIQQPPGERNALGYVKFIFPNDHSVYLHDTPSRSLFGAERRAFSHGCVRVDQPFRLAEEILKSESPWTESKLRALIGKSERHIRLRQTLPVHLTYFTLTIDEHGQVRSFDDLYGIHRKVRAALGYAG